MNFAAPPPAKNTNTASGLIEAISVSNAWNSTLGKCTHSPRTDLPPAMINLSLKPAAASSPGPYFQATLTTFVTPPSPRTLPVGYARAQRVNDVLNISEAHSAPDAA